MFKHYRSSFERFGKVVVIQAIRVREDYAASDPDVQLMLRVADEDYSAFEELVDRYHGHVVSLLIRCLGCHDIVEELTQEAFLRVYLARRRYEPRSRFSTWLFRIVKNLALNAKRAKSRRHELNFAEFRASDFQNRNQPTPFELAKAAERRDVVRQAISQLPPRQYEAVMLKSFSPLNAAEIAEEMQISVAALKSLLYRARCNLRDNLEDRFQEA